MRIGVAFDGTATMAQMLDLARFAEEIGLDSLWMADHIGLRETFTVSSAFLSATSLVKVCPVAINPYSRHPAVTAMAAATLEEIGPGRVILSVGMGNAIDLSEIGLETVRPLRAVREMLLVLKELFSEGKSTYKGKIFHLPHGRLKFSPSSQIPIYVAAMGPKMLELAGEVADGVILSSASSREFIGEARERVAAGAQNAGRDPRSITITSFVMVSHSEHENEAIQGIKRILAWILRGQHHVANMKAAGTSYDREAATELIRLGKWDDAGALVGDEMVRKHAAAGSRDTCIEDLRAYKSTGIDVLIVHPIGPDENAKREILETAHAL